MTFTRWLALLIIALAASTAGAQQYPARTIRLVVGFPPGGGTDIIARLLAQKLTEVWAQQVIVDNRPGATGMIGANVVAKSPPDGYTLLMGHVNSQAIAPALVQKPLYDPLRDFATVAYIGYVPNVLVVHPSTPAKNIKELIALAKAHPGELTFASPGVGSTNHLAGEMFKRATGVNLVHVPYKGSGPAIIDLLAGHIVMNFDAMSSVINYIKQGRMRPLAVTTTERDPQLPDVPTLREVGLKDYNVTNWYGVVAPAATPREIVTRLNAEINRITRLPDVKSKLDELGTRLNPMTPEKFTEFLQAEIAKYQKVAKETGVRME
ncbi:MAG TPA: tripartite tricarboxylate transporter substrate binding protein [Burkholderiales bacterium]|nr:tripartite tricarboxylate transporter substrate binding protein [Burkholderiales bacterium]